MTKKDSLSTSSEKVWLYPPTSKACIVKALLRLGADTYNDLTFQCVDSMNLSEIFMDHLSLMDNIGGILKVLEHIVVGGTSYSSMAEKGEIPHQCKSKATYELIAISETVAEESQNSFQYIHSF